MMVNWYIFWQRNHNHLAGSDLCDLSSLKVVGSMGSFSHTEELVFGVAEWHQAVHTQQLRVSLAHLCRSL